MSQAESYAGGAFDEPPTSLAAAALQLFYVFPLGVCIAGRMRIDIVTLEDVRELSR